MPTAFRSFAVIPAAGRSSRMGRPKLELPWGKTTVIEQTIEAWQSGGVSEVFVVLRDDDSPLAHLVSKTSARTVIAESAPPEMKDSIQVGLRHIEASLAPAASDVWLTAPADMPLISSETIKLLLAAHDENSPAILVPAFQGKSGHPVLFPWCFAEQVSQLGPDQGINQLVKTGPTRLLEAGPAAIPPDIDTYEQYEELRRGNKVSGESL